MPRFPTEAGGSGDHWGVRGVEISEREAEVLAAVGRHLTNTQIASRLHISVRTVESHVSSLLRKYGVTNRRELAIALRYAGEAWESRLRAGRPDSGMMLPSRTPPGRGRRRGPRRRGRRRWTCRPPRSPCGAGAGR